MAELAPESRLGIVIAGEVCAPCQAFWFDQSKDFQLSSRSTLILMKYIGEHTSSSKAVFQQNLMCPRCGTALKLTHDIARSVRFTYWDCVNQHGHFIGFLDFLKEKNFIHPLSPREVQQLRESVHTVNCSRCGASIDLQNNSACPFCKSPITMLDLNEQRQMLEQLKQAAEPKSVDPTLPLILALAKAHTEQLFREHDDDWWQDARSSGDLVQAGRNAVARWLANSFVK